MIEETTCTPQQPELRALARVLGRPVVGLRVRLRYDGWVTEHDLGMVCEVWEDTGFFAVRWFNLDVAGRPKPTPLAELHVERIPMHRFGTRVVMGDL